MHWLRLLVIVNTLIRYRVLELLPDNKRGVNLLKRLLCLWPTRWGPNPAGDASPGTRLRLALEHLGPVFVKFGQLLSTRRDLLDDDIIRDLQGLQDQVPSFDSDAAIQIIETELGKPVSELFKHFDADPLASASVAQVHTATLWDDSDVVIKVIRPDIEKKIIADIGLMKFMARTLERFRPELKRFHPRAVVDDYEGTLLAELDLGREAANTTQFRRNFENSGKLYVPKIYWEYTRTKVMVMERIYGVPVTDIEALEAAGIDLIQLSELGVEIFFTQLFRDNFFHADMHPGNVLVSTENPSQPQYISIDCAIVGSLSKSEQFLLARQLMALLNQDYALMSRLLIEAGWIPKHVRAVEFEHALRSICEPILEQPLDKLEFGPLLVRLFSVARRYEMQALPQFVLLEKTLLHIEGLGRQLYPQLDIWTIARPLLTRWLKEQFGPEALANSVKRNGPAWLHQMTQMPQMAFDALENFSRYQDRQAESEQRMIDLKMRLQQQTRRDNLRMILGCGAIIAAILVNQEFLELPSWQDTPLSVWLLTVAGAVLLWPRSGQNDSKT